MIGPIVSFQVFPEGWPENGYPFFFDGIIILEAAGKFQSEVFRFVDGREPTDTLWVPSKARNERSATNAGYYGT